MRGKSIVLVQPPLLQSCMDVDVVQKKYWEVLENSIHSIITENGISKELNQCDKNFSGFIEPNIGLLYIAAALNKSGYKINYIDAHLQDAKIRKEMQRPIHDDDIKDMLKELPANELNTVAISTLTINFGWAVKIAEIVKQINKKCVVILGGVHASFEYKNILLKHQCIDIISIGEGEESMVEIADQLHENGFQPNLLEKIKGIAYRKDGMVHFTGNRTFISDLDSLPYPMYELLPREQLDNFMIRVITSRGCSNNCSFCVPSKFFNKLRFRDCEKVVNELEYYNKTYGWKTFMIGDLNFLSDYEYAKKFCKEIMERKLNIVWMCQSRVDLISKEITELMQKAGCIMICLGIESAEQEILDNTNKRTTLDRCIQACKTVKESGISLFTFWVFGLPGETHDSAHSTIKLLRKFLDDKLIDYTHCTVCVPFPGTEIYTNPEKFKIKILSDNMDDYWLGCDYLGAGLPVIETEELSNYEIYAYWQMALAVVAGNLPKKIKDR